MPYVLDRITGRLLLISDPDSALFQLFDPAVQAEMLARYTRYTTPVASAEKQVIPSLAELLPLSPYERKQRLASDRRTWIPLATAEEQNV